MMNPFNFGNPVPPDKMVGRRKMANAIIKDLVNPSGHSDMIVGGRRIGKSSLLEALQDLLVKQLYQIEQMDWYLVPIFVNLKRLSGESPEGVFGFITKLIYTSFSMLRTKNVWDASFESDLQNTKLYVFFNSQRNECTLDEFSGIIDEVVDIFGHSHRLLRFVLLIDEVESILGKEWTETLFGYLRSLIYEGTLRNHIRYVISGSSQVIDIKEKGSPLLNMLKIYHLTVLEEKDILNIISWAGIVSQDILQAVFQQCGGHPFITQYIMHYLWENTLSTATPISVLKVANQFTHERFSDLEQWQLSLGNAGLLAYKCLAKADTWLSEPEVRACINQNKIAANVGLVKLCYHGLATHDDTWSTYRFAGELFRNWFVHNVLPSLDIPKDSSHLGTKNVEHNPILEIQFKTRIFPTAYCHSLTSESFPFVVCSVTNTSNIDMRVRIRVTIPGFSDECVDTLDIASRQTEKTVLLPKLKHDVIKKLREIHPTKCNICIYKHTVDGQQLLLEKDYDIRLHAFDTALLATVAEDGRIAEDLTDYLSVFITPHVVEVEQLVRLAAEHLPGLAMPGYQGAENLVQARAISRAQAKAFFDTLKQTSGLLYTNAPINYGKRPLEITQRVRLPFVCLGQGKSQANCIDGSILFASLLENIGMEPLLAIVPGHAFVGWRIWRNIEKYDFLETTMIGTGEFEDALIRGNKRYQDALNNKDNTRSIFHHNGFIRIVDVNDCRKKEITPLM